MRALPAEAVVEALVEPVDVAGIDAAYASVVEGYALYGTPEDVIAEGGHNAVPWIIGTNANETSKSVALDPNASEEEYAAAVQAYSPQFAGEILAHYPAADYPSPWAAYVAMTSDRKFVCGAGRAARAAAKSRAVGVYRYELAHGFDNAPAQAKYGVWHGADLAYIFDHLEQGGYDPSEDDQAVAHAMIGYWTRLAASGDPNGRQAIEWSPYDATEPYLVLDMPLALDSGLRTAQCDFWDNLFSD
jgi:para-nitrobenzyl esterase